MTDNAATKPTEKKVAVTVYMTLSLESKITAAYAAALLNGYKGTRQAFYSVLITKGLDDSGKEV